MIASGFIFLFLSKVKHMSDDDLQRAMSVYADGNKAAMKKRGSKFASDHKDVIAKVAYDNKEVLADAAYDNREMLADAYVQKQNQNYSSGY